MFQSLKNRIYLLAKEAVTTVEKNLVGQEGKLKKTAAVKYVVSHLPVHDSIKYILGVVLSVFIDSAVEIAVVYMNNHEIVEE